MLVVERRVGQTLVFKPKWPHARPFRIVVVLQAGLESSSFAWLSETEMLFRAPMRKHDIWLDTPNEEKVLVSVDRVSGGRAKVAIEAPKTVLVLRGEIEDRRRDCG